MGLLEVLGKGPGVLVARQITAATIAQDYMNGVPLIHDPHSKQGNLRRQFRTAQTGNPPIDAGPLPSLPLKSSTKMLMSPLNRFQRTATALLLGLACGVAVQAAAESLKLELRRLVPADSGRTQWRQVTNSATWEPGATAVVICDMWDKHWCKGASARVAEMAPRMNQVIGELRRRGVLIIHCPSETMKFYEGTPGRKLAQAAPAVPVKQPLQGWCKLDSVREPPLPIDDSDGGCDDEPTCQQGSPWRREIATLEIQPGDAITDSAEAFNLMRERGITNVIVMGVHQNMCVLGRPFSI